MADTNPVWTFTMSKASRDYNSAKHGRGTTITVTQLHEAVREDLADGGFVSLLREQIRFRHQGALAEGITVTLNGERLDHFSRELLSGPGFNPINRTFVVSSEHGDVAVRIIAGITRPERKDVGKDDGDADNFRTGTDAGWWIFCNDRLLLMRERTRLTGWGDSLPNYHPPVPPVPRLRVPQRRVDSGPAVEHDEDRRRRRVAGLAQSPSATQGRRRPGRGSARSPEARGADIG
ncbi:MAG: hypothetical protein ACRD1K_17955 [Acidimicrobiales bacterium]